MSAELAPAAPPLSRSPILSDRQGFDRRWFAPNLQVVYTPSDTVGVLQAMKQAIQLGFQPGQIQITCGRHCYENFVYNGNTRCIIDMTGLRAYGYDNTYGYFMEVGNGNWDMYRTLNNVYGRTLPAGSCYSVGLGGHITGGGYGLLSRLYGLLIDHLTAVEMVVMPSGSQTNPMVVVCSAAQNSDLFWAVRGGGGGNFGIITRYYFANPPMSPQRMLVSTLSLPWSNITSASVLQQYLDSFAQYDVIQAPNNTFSIFHLNHQAAGAMSMSTFRYYDTALHGEQAEFEDEVAKHVKEQRRRYEAIGPLSDQPAPHIGHPGWMADNSPFLPAPDITYRNYTYLEGTQQVNGSGPNRYGKYKSAYMKKPFPPDQVAALYYHLQRVPNGVPASDMAQSLCQVDSYGGAINNVAWNATAVPQRNSIMKLQYQTYWDNASPVGSDDPVQAAAHLDWINTMYRDVYAAYGGFPDPSKDPSGTVDGCYYNYCDSDLGTNGVLYPGIDHAMRLYFLGNYAQLKSAKGKWNPSDWFKSAQSIPV